MKSRSNGAILILIVFIFLLWLGIAFGLKWASSHLSIPEDINTFLGFKGFTLATLTELTLEFMIIMGISLFVVHIYDRKYGPTRFSIDHITNKSEITFLDDKVASLDLEAQRLLEADVKRVVHRLKHHSRRHGLESHSASLFYFNPLPSSEKLVDQSLENITAVFPEGTPPQISLVMSFLETFFPSHHIHVVRSIQCIRKDSQYQIAFVFEILGTRNDDGPVIFSIPDSKYVDKEQVYERTQKLLRVATNALALELCKQAMLYRPSSLISSLGTGNSYQAKVYNFFGVLYAKHAKAHDGFFYRQAVHNFKRARKLKQHWRRPHANLADLYSCWGQAIEEEEGQTQSEKHTEKFRMLQIAALREYSKCLHPWNAFWLGLYTRIPHALLGTTVSEASVSLQGWEFPHKIFSRHFWVLMRNDKKEIETQIEVGEARVQLLMDEPAFTKTAKETLLAIEKRWKDFSRIQDPRTLYYLACWYAIAYEKEGKNPTQAYEAKRYFYKASQCLCYCLARNTADLTDPGDLTLLSKNEKSGQAEEDQENLEDLEDHDWYYWRRSRDDIDLRSMREEIDRIKQKLGDEIRKNYYQALKELPKSGCLSPDESVTNHTPN